MIDLKELGLDTEQLQQMVVERITQQLLYYISVDDDDYGHHLDSKFSESLRKQIKERADRRVDEIAAERLEPVMREQLDKLEIQKTNQFGEAKGEPIPFVEYVAKRAEEYMQQPVDYKGNPAESLRQGESTRLAYLVDVHLGKTIHEGIQGAASDISAEIAKSVNTMVKAQLADLQQTIQVELKRKR